MSKRRFWSGTCGESATSSPRWGSIGTPQAFLLPPPSALDSAAGPVPPPRSVRIEGEVLDPQASKKAERALMDRKLGANPDDADALIQRGWLSLTEGDCPRP